MITNVLVIGYVNSADIYINTVNQATLPLAVLITIILVFTCLSVWILAADLESLLEELSKENDRVIRSEAENKQLLHYDSLTNLPNRVMAKELFENALVHSKRSNSKMCVMLIDLDNFKNLNDTLGHSHGDKFLLLLAVKMVSMLRETDNVCRLEGDQFLIIIEHLNDKFEILKIADKFLQDIILPIDFEGHSTSITCSVGIALAPEDGDSFDSITNSADIAMYQAKESGKNNYCFYNQQMNTEAKNRISIIRDLHHALSEKQLELFYQPKIELKSGNIIGAEALLRWNHPEKGFIPPNTIIPIAESSGMIIELGKWIIEQACADCKSWTSEGLDLDVAVNVSQIQFKRRNLVSIVLEALEKSDLDGKLLELEMTESLMIEQSEDFNHTLRALGRAGVRFSIDDFGTGYSNLSYLKNFEVETLKIDRSFISKVLTSPQDKALVLAIIQMSSALNMKTVAEGIEDEDTLKYCEQISCDIGQGYYWTKPIPKDKFIEYVKNYNTKHFLKTIHK